MAARRYGTTHPGALGDPFITDRAEEIYGYPYAAVALVPVAVHPELVGGGLGSLCARRTNDIRGAGHFDRGDTAMTCRLGEPVHHLSLYVAVADFGELALIHLFLLALKQGHRIFLVREFGYLGRLFQVESAAGPESARSVELLEIVLYLVCDIARGRRHMLRYPLAAGGVVKIDRYPRYADIHGPAL